MNVFVIADRPIASLFPPERNLEPPLLPLGGRSLLERLLNVLAANFDEVGVVVPQSCVQTWRWLAENKFPPLKLELTTPQDVVVRDRSLFIRGDIVLSPVRLANTLTAWTRGERMTAHAPTAGFHVVDAGTAPPSWKSFCKQLTSASQRDSVHIRNAGLTPNHYHALVIAAADNRLPDVTPSGWLDPDGLRLGLDAHILTRLAPGSGSTVGARAFVDRNVVIGDGVVIGEECVIGRGTQLANSIVLPGVCVGKHLVIRDAIVGDDWIYRTDLGSFSNLANTGLVGRHVA